MPFDLRNIDIEPVYEGFNSWKDIEKGSIPPTLDKYIQFVEDYLDVPVTMVSIGPGREELIDLATGDLIA